MSIFYKNTNISAETKFPISSSFRREAHNKVKWWQFLALLLSLFMSEKIHTPRILPSWKVSGYFIKWWQCVLLKEELTTEHRYIGFLFSEYMMQIFNAKWKWITNLPQFCFYSFHGSSSFFYLFSKLLNMSMRRIVTKHAMQITAD